MPELTVSEIEKLIDQRAEAKARELFDKLHQPATQVAPVPEPKAEPGPTAPPPHKMRSWEKTCPECGLSNPDFKQANVACADCGSPIGNLPEDWQPPKPGETKTVAEIKPCWNCGSEKAKLRHA